jgi:hypothetical protein
MATVEFRYDPKNTAWFTANAAMVLKAGEPAYHDTTGLFKLGDGVTALSALSFLPTVSASTPTIQQVLTAGQVATTTIETTGFVKTGGLSTQFLKADGTVDSNVYGVGNALTSNPLSQFAATTSSQLAGVISDETGSGALVFGTSPTFTTNITTPLIVGGSAVGSVIQYKGTSGVGTSTVAAHQFLVGNNGATTAMNIQNNGNVYIPTGGLAVGGGFSVVPTGAGFELEYSAPTAFVTAYNRTGGAWIPMTIRGAALTFQSSNNTIISSTATGTALTFSGATSAATAITNFTFNATANTNQTLGTNIPNFKITGANKQWATGALATQYFNYFTANTVSFVGASTATNVYNLFCESPIAGVNASITNRYAAGFDGDIRIVGNGVGTTNPFRIQGYVSAPASLTAFYTAATPSAINYNIVFDPTYTIVGGTVGSYFRVNNVTNMQVLNTGITVGLTTSQKISFWNATPIVQPTTAVAAATVVSGTGGNVKHDDTFDGYTLEKIVRALRTIGLLA